MQDVYVSLTVLYCLQMLLKDLVNSTLLRLHQFLLVLDCYPFKDVFNEKYRQDLPLYSQRCGYEIVVEGRKEIEVHN